MRERRDRLTGGVRPLLLLLGPLAGLVAALLWVSALSLASEPSPVLIDGVLYDGYALNDADEAVRLVNADGAAVDVSGWRLSDGGSSTAVLPAGTILPPGGALWLTGDAAAFRVQFGHDADLTLAPWPGFANAGDEVVLLDAGGM
ncbi:MAG TPA: lamin tail domain-containing protein, partial [Promineifilum sp.]|nr:lamin tail domain-containing protein [Promineifilum sp.]